ncbi:MAG: PAS domain S-box protein [Acidobacteria bacterium]|nr:PAS domain S-box protein [Acidobacteriota bacterium]
METSVKKKMWIGFGLYLVLFFFMTLMLFVNLSVTFFDSIALLGAAAFVLFVLFVAYRWTINDLRERQEVEADLRESEERHRDMLENASDLIQSVTPGGKFLYVNQAWLKALGYKATELAALSLFDILHPDCKDDCLRTLKTLMAGKKSGLEEASLVTKSGKTIIVEGTMNCSFRNGKPIAIRAIFRDVTQRKIAEKALVESEKRYRELVTKSKGLICIHDLQGKLLSFNPAAANSLGYDREELTGKKMTDLLHPSVRHLWADYLQRIQKEKSVSGYLIVVTRRGQQRIWVYSNSLYEEPGKPPYVVGHAQDLTEFRDSEALNHRLKSIVEATTDFVITATPEGQLLYANAAMKKALGIGDDEDLKHRQFSDFLGREAAAVLQKEAIPQAITQGVWSGESRLRTANGQALPISQVVIAHKSRSDDVRYISWVARDLSAQKAIQNRLHAQEAITQTMAKAVSLSEAIPQVLETICKTLHWKVGAFWKLNRQTAALECRAFWSDVELPIAEFATVTRAAVLPLGEGLPGRVLAGGKPLWIDDVKDTHFFTRASEAAKANLHNAFAFPIFLGEVPLGVVEFFCTQVRPPDFELFNLMTSIGSQIGQFIERKHAEDAMRESEARKSAILQSALDCIITIDHEGKVVEFNPAAETTFGYRCEQIVGKLFVELMAQHAMTFEQRLLLDPYFAAGDQQATGRRIEVIALRADGSEFPADLAIAPIATDGAPMFTAFLRDISDSKHSQKALQQSNDLLKALSRAQSEFLTEVQPPVLFSKLLEDLLVLTRSRYGCLSEIVRGDHHESGLQTLATVSRDWDAQTCEVYDADMLTDKTMQILQTRFQELLKPRPLPGEKLSPLVSPVAEFIRGALEFRAVLALPIYCGDEMIGMLGLADRADGFDDALLEFLQPFTAACGNLLQAYRNEQKRKQAEQEVATLSLVASKTDNAVLITNHRQQIEWVNDAFTRMTGYSLEEMRGRMPREILIGPDADSETLRHLDEALQAKINFTVEILQYRKNGEPHWVSMNISPVLNEAGEVLQFIAVQTEITERMNKEEALCQAMVAAEAASVAKSQFLAVMSHEIRTPLNAIIGMTDLALHTKLTPEQYEYLKTVQTNSEALLYLINDILDFSKIEGGQMDLDKLAFNPAEIVEGVAEMLSVRAVSKRLELVCNIGDALPLRVLGDPNRFRQILLNLVGNALKFTEVGEVVITLEALESADAETVELAITVADTGIGIAAQHRDKVFEKFYQADNSTTRKYGGSGLGLSISKLLAEKLNGRLWFDSEGGKGSTFYCRLPFALVEGCEASGKVEAFCDYRALVVDDNSSSLTQLTRLLQALGLTVASARRGSQALEMLQAEGAAYDVILLDKVMPGMDGVELARTLRRLPNYAHTRLILMSPLGMEDAALMQELHIGEPLSKPVLKARLQQALTQALPTRKAPPAPPATIVEAAPKNQLHAEPHRYAILVVEDNPANQHLARRILESAGYAVEIAENGKLAVEYSRERIYDLILMDIQMPLMDGITATAEIRKMEKQRHQRPTPIVALTAHAIEGYREKCIENGMNEYLSKPVNRKLLLNIVNQWLDKRPVVLIVDDSAPSHILIKNYLKEAEYQLFFAHNGQQGLEFLKRHWVSLVLLDMEMPVLNGYATATAIRQLGGFEQLPVIAMTGHDGLEEKQKCLASGCSDYVAKPLRKQNILEVIDRNLRAACVPAPLPQADIKAVEKADIAATVQVEMPICEPLAETVEPVAAAEVCVYVDEDIADLVPEFLEGRRDDVQKIRAMIEEHNYSVLYTLGHDMKGCGMGYGFEEISLIGKHIEAAAKEQNAPEILLWNNKLADYLNAVKVMTR